jgi:hypothetical protein
MEKKNIIDFGESDKLSEETYLASLENDLNSDTITHNLPWIEKYRPNNFEEIVSHNNILNALDNSC